MKTFTVEKFVHNILTQKTELQFTVNINAEPKQITQTFAQKEAALAFLNSNMRDYLLGVLDDYVNHKKHIIQAGNHPNQLKPLQICEDALFRFHKNFLSLATIADQFLKGFEWFETILPAQQNPSYQSSLETLTYLKNFCTTIKNNQLPSEY